MKGFAEWKAILNRVSSDFPKSFRGGVRLLWERSGNFDEALKIAKNRLLVAFFQTTDFCNGRCMMCGAKFMRRTRQIMPMDIYRMAIGQLAEARGHSAMLSAFGEPMLDPYIVERVAFARDFPVIKNIGFSTNGSLLSAEKYRLLAQAGLKNISISIDGFCKEAYEKIRIGLSFEKLEKNITEVIAIHEALSRPITITVSSFTRESPRQLGRSRLYRRLTEAGITPGLKWRVDNWGGLISRVDGGLYLMKPRPRRDPCSLLYDSSVLVLPDGRVSPCHCRDLEGDLFIGNIRENSLLNIWQGGFLEKIRDEQAKGKFRPPCERCSGYIPLKSWFTRSMVGWIRAYNDRVPLNAA